nr:unnamed protein product [Callosobruchus analis]
MPQAQAQYNLNITYCFVHKQNIRDKYTRQVQAEFEQILIDAENLMKDRNSAKSKFKKRPSDQNWTSYKELRNRANHAIVQEKRKYFTEVATNRNKRKLWKELKYLNISSQNAAIPTHLQNTISSSILQSDNLLIRPRNLEWLQLVEILSNLILIVFIMIWKELRFLEFMAQIMLI